MKESTSRILAGLEGALLCLPVTALFLYGGLPGIYYFLINSPKLNDILDSFAAMAIILALICAWRLLWAFIFGGRSKLQTVSNRWWIIPYATAALSLIAPLFVVITSIPSALGMFAWGLPMILPLAHVHLERKAKRIHK
jgi:hypothetical protein